MDQKTLHEWLNYDPETGVFTWKKRPANCRKPGDVAGTLSKSRGGERNMLCVQGRRYYAGRAAYIYVHGDIPKTSLVDHINGDKADDRIANLRIANTAQNTWNRVQREGTKYKMGVSKLPRGRFRSAIQLPTGKKHFLGTWDTEEEAHAAYMGAAAILHGDFWLGNRP